MNDQQRAAMQMALEALEGVGEQTFFQDGWDGVNKLNAAITAMREALVQPQKPDECANGCPERTVCDYCTAQPQGEPVAWVIWGEGNVPELAWDTPKPDDVANALYYTPPSVEAAIEATKEKMKKVFAVATPKSTWTTDRIIAEIEDMK